MARARPSATALSADSTVTCHPGELVSLQWIVLNDGVEAWPAGCIVQPLRDGTPAGQPLVAAPEVDAKCRVELGFEIVAPGRPMEVKQEFSLVAPTGELFGDVLCGHLVVLPKQSLPKYLFPGDHSRTLLRNFVREPLEPGVDRGPMVKAEDIWSIVRETPVLPQALVSRFGSPESAKLQFHVNGELQTVASGDYPVTMTLADYLRYEKDQTGTKVQCGEGGCGACTVSVQVMCQETGTAGGSFIVNACMRPLHLLGGMEITTVEALGTPEQPHAIQSTLIKHGGSQCGACTPGFVMAIYGHMTKGGDVHKDLEACVQGNICRCTGYRPIYDAIHDLASGPAIPAVRRKKPQTPVEQEVNGPGRRALFAFGEQLWVNCKDMGDIFHALAMCGDRPHRLVVGNTSVGVVKYYPAFVDDNPQVFINISTVPDLLSVERSEAGLTIGAAVPIARLISVLDDESKAKPQFTSIVKHLKLIAHPQVRNVGSWGGNVMIAKTHPDFPSDICLLFATLGAKLTLVDSAGACTDVEVDKFLKDDTMPRKGADPQILKSVFIPNPSSTSIIETFKVMRRHMNTHAEVNAGFVFDFNDAKGIDVKDARIVVGNISHGPLIATDTASQLLGKPLEAAAIGQALQEFTKELTVADPTVEDPPFVVLGASYRQNLSRNIFYKAAQRARLARLGSEALTPAERSAADLFERGSSSGSLTYPEPDPKKDPIGKEKTKYKGLEQACGVTQYTADTPLKPGTLFAAAVLAKQVGVIADIDLTECFQVEQVQYFISADDIAKVGASNSVEGVPGAYLPKVFADKQHSTGYVGELIGLVLADSLVQAQAGAKVVKVKYEQHEEHSSDVCLAGKTEKVECSSMPARPRSQEAKAVKTITGEVRSTGQRHFYLETQTSYGYLNPQGELVVTIATQYAQFAEQCMQKVLPKDQKFTLEVPQLGGAYGGKNFLSVPGCLAVSIATLATKRPVMYPIDRNSDFLTFGTRPEFLGKWTCDFDPETLKMEHLNQEATRSVAIGNAKAEFPVTGLNCYELDGSKFKFENIAKEENVAPITIMRCPNFFEASFFMEAIIEHIARDAGKEPFQVQEANMNMTPKGMAPVWNKAKEMMDFDKVRASVAAFNKEHKYQKQGLYLMGSEYVTTNKTFAERLFLKVDPDGTVRLDHSGIEMGQGLDTKVVQACIMKLRALATDVNEQDVMVIAPRAERKFEWIKIDPTWGSGTSESMVLTVMRACDSIIAKMQKYVSPGKTWKEVVAAAVAGKEDLSAQAEHLHTEGEDYPVHCAAGTVVQIDTLTGDTQVLSLDLAYDAGQSMNPQVDVGQIEGSLIQALGFSLIEAVTRSEKDKRMINCGTWDYKVPTGFDIPIKMNVALLDLKDTGKLVLSSKMTGEPAQICGLGAFFAVKDAILAARRDNGKDGYFPMDQPASPDRILEACETSLPAHSWC